MKQKLVKRRLTPQEDFDRLGETIYNMPEFDIEDQESFNKAYDNYMEGVQRDPILKKKTWEYVKTKIVFTEAGGKDIKQDKRTLAKTVVTKKKEYIKRGARHVDMVGIDTPDYLVGKVKNKWVYAKPVVIKVRGKKQVKYRDSKGRFAKIVSIGGKK